MSPKRIKLNLLLQPSSPRNENQYLNTHQQYLHESSISSKSQRRNQSQHTHPSTHRIQKTHYNPRRDSTNTSPSKSSETSFKAPKLRIRKDIYWRSGSSRNSLLNGSNPEILLRTKSRFMEERKNEVDEQLLKEQFAEDSRIIRQRVGGGEMSEEGGRLSGGGGGGGDGSAQERGRVRSRSDVGGGYSRSANEDMGDAGGGYSESANGAMGNLGCGIGSGDFRGRAPELEQNEVVLEGPLVALKAALLAGRFSDLTIFHGVRVWSAHKVVVCSQSQVLESMIDNTGLTNMFGGQTNSGILNLSSFPLDSVTALMEYLYTSAYSIPAPPAGSSPCASTYESGPSYSLPLHEQIFYLAVDLQIPALETLAAASFRHTLNTQISNLDIYFASITRIYGKTTERNPGLRNALVEAAVQELGGLLGDEGMKERLWKAMSANKEFWEGMFRFLGSSSDRDVEVREVVREVRVPVEVERVVEKIVEREVEVQSDRILCDDCGPINDEDEYEMKCVCRSCGLEKVITFT